MSDVDMAELQRWSRNAGGARRTEAAVTVAWPNSHFVESAYLAA